MKAKIVSDQHFEFRACGNYRGYFELIHSPREERADICILAGDFDVIRRRSQAPLTELCGEEEQVVYIPGNHEYYGCTNMSAVDDALLEIEQSLSNLKILRTGTVFEFAGRRFLGDTMCVPKTTNLMLSKHLVNDSRVIPNLLNEIGDRHQKFIDWLTEELREDDIVVTHHLPSDRSTPAPYRTSATQAWFVASRAERLFAKKPKVWIHGHTHQRCDYVLDETRVICNPLGYPNENGELPGTLAPFLFEI